MWAASWLFMGAMVAGRVAGSPLNLRLCESYYNLDDGSHASTVLEASGLYDLSAGEDFGFRLEFMGRLDERYCI